MSASSGWILSDMVSAAAVGHLPPTLVEYRRRSLGLQALAVVLVWTSRNRKGEGHRQKFVVEISVEVTGCLPEIPPPMEVLKREHGRVNL